MLRLRGLNMGRALLGQAKVLELYKRLMVAIGSHDVPQLRYLVRNGLKNKLSIQTILKRILMAADGVISVRSYEEVDYEKAYIILVLGGRACIELSCLRTPVTGVLFRIGS